MTDDTPDLAKYATEMFDLLCRLHGSYEFSPRELFIEECSDIIHYEIGPLLKRMGQ